jgi:hypothetical protein
VFIIFGGILLFFVKFCYRRQKFIVFNLAKYNVLYTYFIIFFPRYTPTVNFVTCLQYYMYFFAKFREIPKNLMDFSSSLAHFTCSVDSEFSDPFRDFRLDPDPLKMTADRQHLKYQRH